MAYKVLIPQDIAPAGKDYLKEKGYEVCIGSGYSNEILKKEIGDFDGVIVRNFLFPGDVIRQGKKLKVIARHGVGVDNIDIQTATELGIHVTFAPESNAISVAEHTIGVIIALAHNFTMCDRELKKGNFEIRHQLNLIDIQSKTLGIIGLGRIGKIVAKKARMGLEMNVIAYDPYITSMDSELDLTLTPNLDALLKASDFITVHIPLSPKTQNLIGRTELKMMKPSAYLINIARGGIINEYDLFETLRDKKIAGASLDVFEQEPPAADNPLFTLDNILVTPHSATLTKECMVRMGLHAAMGVHEVLSGQEPKWAVNKVETTRRVTPL